MAKNIKPVTTAEFGDTVLKSEKLVLVDFWAEWCGPCKMLEPTIDEIAGEMADQVCFYKLNVDEEGDTAMDYSITSIPTLLIFKGGEAIDAITGAVPKNVIISKLKEHI